MDTRFAALLEECVRRNASDLHLSCGVPVYARQGGELVQVSPKPMLAHQLEEMIASVLSDGQREVLRASGTVDVAFSMKGARFRGHAFRERRGLSFAARRLEDGFRSLADLNLPNGISELARLQDGLVLFTGPTGSGKSTTLATLLDQINRERACHILTIEDPIEYLHENKQSLIHQRELHRDVGSFPDAVRASLREDPDVVLVGEMRDVETMRAAIMVAETGHLVFSTLHCGNAVGALDRIIGAFSAGERDSLCQQLSMVLKAVIAQHLLPGLERTRRVPAVEILRVNKAIANLIRSHKPEQIYSAMENGGELGMQTLEQSLSRLVSDRAIDVQVALGTTENVRVLEQRLRMTNGYAARVMS